MQTVTLTIISPFPISVVIHDVHPVQQEFPFLGLALYQLRRRDDGDPLLHILFCRVALQAEEVEIFVRKRRVAVQREEQEGARRVRGSVALRGVRPVDDVRLSVLVGDDDVAGVEVAVAHLVVLGHCFEAGVQIVTDRRGEIRLGDLAVHLVIEFVEQGSALGVYLKLQIDETVEIFPDRKNILFRMGNTTLITRLIDGEFLNYRAAIPAEFEHVVTADRHDLITCIERVSLIVSEKLKNPVRLHFDGNYVQMSCITAVGKSYDECPFDGNIEGLEIGFNNRYLLDALRAAGDDKVLVHLKGALNPIVITPLEGDKYTYLVLPVRLKAND